MIDETGKPALWPRYWTPLPTYKNLDNGLFYYPGGSSNSGYPGPSGGSGNFNNGL